MKEIMEKVKEEVPEWADLCYPVHTNNGKISFIARSSKNNLYGYKKITYNYSSEKIEGDTIKYIDHKDLADDIDLTTNDLFDIW